LTCTKATAPPRLVISTPSAVESQSWPYLLFEQPLDVGGDCRRTGRTKMSAGRSPGDAEPAVDPRCPGSVPARAFPLHRGNKPGMRCERLQVRPERKRHRRRQDPIKRGVKARCRVGSRVGNEPMHAVGEGGDFDDHAGVVIVSFRSAAFRVQACKPGPNRRERSPAVRGACGAPGRRLRELPAASG
jgi:hypothetical protein